jgi:hypothetical protein
VCFLKILWRIISRYPNRIRTHLSHYTHTHTHRRRRRGELASLVTLFSTWHQHNFSFLIWWDTHDDTIRQSVVFVDKKRKMATRVEQIKMIFLLMDGKNKFFFFQLYVCVCVWWWNKTKKLVPVRSSAQDGHLVWKAQVDWLPVPRWDKNWENSEKWVKNSTHSGGQDVQLWCVCVSERARALRCDCGERTPLKKINYFFFFLKKKNPRLPLSYSTHTQVCSAVCVRSALEVGAAAAAAVVAGGECD